MKRFIVILLCACLMTGAFAESAPERVAVLFSSYAEMWLEAGGEIFATVGESIERGFAAENTYLVDDGAGKTVNMELLLACQPDLVILSSDIAAQSSAIGVLESAGIRCMSLRVENFNDYAEAFGMMTSITGNAETYDAFVNAQVDEIDRLLSENRFDGTLYAFIRAGSSASSTKLKQSQEHFACDMLNGFGLVNMADEGIAASGSVNIETLLSRDPEYIFVSLMGDEDAARASVLHMMSAPEWQYLSAVRNGKVIILPKSLFHYKPCSRWAEAYRYLLDILSA